MTGVLVVLAADLIDGGEDVPADFHRPAPVVFEEVLDIRFQAAAGFGDIGAGKSTARLLRQTNLCARCGNRLPRVLDLPRRARLRGLRWTSSRCRSSQLVGSSSASSVDMTDAANLNQAFVVHKSSSPVALCRASTAQAGATSSARQACS